MSLYAELIQGLAVERIVIGLFSPDGERVRVRGLSIVTLNSIQSRIVERIARWLNKLKPSILVGDSGSEAGVTHWQLMQGIPCRIWIIRVVGKLIVSLHLTGLVRFRSRIALPKIQQGILNHVPLFRMTNKIKPLRETPHPVLPQSGEGVFKDSLPYSGRVRVGSDWFFVIPGCDPESHSWMDYEGRNNFKTF